MYRHRRTKPVRRCSPVSLLGLKVPSLLDGGYTGFPVQLRLSPRMLFPEGYSSYFSSYVARAASAAYCIASISLLLTRGREGRKSPSRGCFSTRDIRLCLSLSGAVECPVSRRSWRTAASRHLARGMECRTSQCFRDRKSTSLNSSH